MWEGQMNMVKKVKMEREMDRWMEGRKDGWQETKHKWKK